jgi:hypothetical protein
MSLLERLFDERFLEHRRRSTSYAGIASALVAILLFAYRYYFEHRWSWDLFAVGVTSALVKLALMTWYSLKD